MLFTEWDWNEAMKIEREEALEEGLKKGMEKGRKEGREEGRKEIILSLLNSLSIEQIASMLKIPISEVQQVAES